MFRLMRARLYNTLPHSLSGLTPCCSSIDKDFEIVVVYHESGGCGLPSPLLGPFAATLDEASGGAGTVAMDLREQADATLGHFISDVYRGLRLERRVAVGRPFEQIVE